MLSDPVIVENLPPTNGQLSSRIDLYSSFKTSSPNLSHSSTSSPFSSSTSSCRTNPTFSINQLNSNSSLSSNHRKESTLKLPYPVLSDHRDSSSILDLLQKETQRTSKKISDVIKQIAECEHRLTSNVYTTNEKQLFKSERVKFKQQLDALKKHERRVSLQIDFITTKTEIKGLEEEENAIECEQIQILVGKLKQKLEKMKIYMRTRNEQMKKLSQNKQRLATSNGSSTGKVFSNRKHSVTSTNHSHGNKRLKSNAPIVRLTSRAISHESTKHHINQPPIVRFINKTTNSKMNSASPTTPASSSSTFSPPLISNSSISNGKTKTNSLLKNEVDDDEVDLELDMDELFNDDSYSESTVQKLKSK